MVLKKKIRTKARIAVAQERGREFVEKRSYPFEGTSKGEGKNDLEQKRRRETRQKRGRGQQKEEKETTCHRERIQRPLPGEGTPKGRGGAITSSQISTKKEKDISSTRNERIEKNINNNN